MLVVVAGRDACRMTESRNTNLDTKKMSDKLHSVPQNERGSNALAECSKFDKKILTITKLLKKGFMNVGAPLFERNGVASCDRGYLAH